ncbi:MAG: patatin-like phospholipase family protein [Terriglobia bacterium]
MKAQEWKQKLQQAVERVRTFAREQGKPALSFRRTPRRLGLALSGGFARGLSHIGVLRVLEENGIPVHFLAGTSIGGLIAGAYASGARLDAIAAAAHRVRWKDFGQWTLSRMGLASNKRMEALVRRIFRALRFEDLKIPLAIVATDLKAAEPVVFTSGRLVPAVRASCAYPGLFLPVEHEGKLLADGALVAPVPTNAVRALGADVVLAVHLDCIDTETEPKTMVDVLSRSLGIAARSSEPVWRKQADLVIEPEVNDYRWDSFEQASELIAAGEQAMRDVLPRLEKLLQPKRLPRAAAF